jgi:7-cyano-7-deazaguanine synthase in queuosine biosynthesis
MWGVIGVVDRFVRDNDNIGIFISGGFDSAVLAALACRSMIDGRQVTIYTVPRYDDSLVHSERVVGWLRTQYPAIDFTLTVVGDPTLHHSQQVASGIEAALKKGDVKILLADTGLPDEVLEGEAPVRVKSGGPRVVQPFFDYDKRVTVQLAEWMGLLNEISDISHTCTESKTIRCGACWQCRERSWAFSKLGIVDRGTM